MADSNDKKQHFIDLLHELFQLDQPELDFGFYKIMHAKSGQIQRFINEELSQHIDEAFAGQGSQAAEDKLAQARQAVIDNVDPNAFENGELKPAYHNSPAGKRFLEAQQELREGGALSDDAQVYDHLYRFFSRYYDQGDFLSTRYRQAPSDTRDAPYSVPYDGREVYLHWANKDQYYIKSSETLRDYRFDLNAAVRGLGGGDQPQSGFDFGTNDDIPRHVQFRIVDAAQGAHGNVKENEQRFFLIHEAEPIRLDGNELTIQFEYRPDPNKSGQNKKWQEKRLEQAETAILAALDECGDDAAAFQQALRIPAPTEKSAERTLLAKHLTKYTARHTMDYFIHKDLGGFLRRELDFYIKNEVMRLDHIESADAPAVEDYLGKVKVIRKIARRIITFLAQLEDFQKKLWLKKKFVTEMNYCITLDRIPEAFYPDITENKEQWKQWEELGLLDDASKKTTDDLKAHPFRMVDTALFSEAFTANLISSVGNIDTIANGLLFNCDNFQTLKLINKCYEQAVTSIYLDPPYNTDAAPILYKNEFKDSSWLSMISNRLEACKPLEAGSAITCITIDDVEMHRLQLALEEARHPALGVVAIKNNPAGRTATVGFSTSHEYALFFGDPTKAVVGRLEHSEKQKARYKEKDDLGAFEWTNFRKHGGTNTYREMRPRQYYPIYIDGQSIRIPKMDWDENARDWEVLEQPTESESVLYPIDEKGRERIWDFGADTAEKNLQHLRVSPDSKGQSAVYRKWRINAEGLLPQTIWDSSKMSAAAYGTQLLFGLFGDKHKFSFPKSVPAVVDCLRTTRAGFEKNGLILDYFAGSGTTGHAVMHMNRQDCGSRKYILVEQGEYFYDVLKPRLIKLAYSAHWSNGKPRAPESGISQCFKYLRLESYEDALNNLVLHEDADRDAALEADDELRHDYILHYWLDTETRGSQSLLNIEHFRDPTNYRMRIKQPGSDESREQPVDLVETFNWLIGLHVELLDKPRTFAAEFERETDPDLPEGAATRLRVTGRLREREDGDFWFRRVEGWVARTPGSTEDVDKVLVIWRKLTDNPEEDAAVLEKLLTQHLRINQRDTEFDAIYINGPHGLSSDFEGKYRLHSLEEAFHAAMWAQD